MEKIEKPVHTQRGKKPRAAKKKITKKLIRFQSTATKQVMEYGKRSKIKDFHKALHSLLSLGYEAFQQSRGQK